MGAWGLCSLINIKSYLGGFTNPDLNPFLRKSRIFKSFCITGFGFGFKSSRSCVVLKSNPDLYNPFLADLSHINPCIFALKSSKNCKNWCLDNLWILFFQKTNNLHFALKFYLNLANLHTEVGKF